MNFKKLTKVNYIVVHCAATKPSMDIDAAEIRRWHLQRGFFDIGYHFVIKRDGTREDGRPLDTPGAHARGYNDRSIAVCLVGGLAEDGKTPEDNFTDEQKETLMEIILGLKFDYPLATVCGHRDLQGVTKACPSFDVNDWLDSLV